jgi:hypothetical protein
MVDELEWVCRQLDRLAMTRLTVWFDAELESEYERLARRECQLLLARNAAMN